MASASPDPTRVATLVHQLRTRFGPQELGQVMQTLLALSFQAEGFQVVKNAVGVPDLQAYREDSPPGFAIEAKTGDVSVTVSQRDLNGVLKTPRTPVLAAYFLSDPVPRWWVISAMGLRPISYRRYELQGRTPVMVGFDVTDRFSQTLLVHYRTAIEGPSPLARLLGR